MQLNFYIQNINMIIIVEVMDQLHYYNFTAKIYGY